MLKKLPDSEFEVMDIIWNCEGDVTSNVILAKMRKNCKLPTVISYLKRLEEKGFLTKEKNGKEYLYRPIITKDDYLKFETNLFIKQYHNNSLFSFMSALVQSKPLSAEEIELLTAELEKYKDDTEG